MINRILASAVLMAGMGLVSCQSTSSIHSPKQYRSGFSAPIVRDTSDANHRSATPAVPVSAAAGSWLDIAKTQLGVKELSGSRNNPRIVDYHRTTIDSARWKNGMPDSVDWCSSFVNWVVKKAGINGTNKGNARSWLSWGQRLNKPVPGCVVVFWRDSLSSWKGHVGFYVGEAGSHVKVLGGNQDNAVTISTYPKGRILGYRWPSNTPLPSH